MVYVCCSTWKDLNQIAINGISTSIDIGVALLTKRLLPRDRILPDQTTSCRPHLSPICKNKTHDINWLLFMLHVISQRGTIYVVNPRPSLFEIFNTRPLWVSKWPSSVVFVETTSFMYPIIWFRWKHRESCCLVIRGWMLCNHRWPWLRNGKDRVTMGCVGGVGHWAMWQ